MDQNKIRAKRLLPLGAHSLLEELVHGHTKIVSEAGCAEEDNKVTWVFRAERGTLGLPNLGYCLKSLQNSFLLLNMYS